MSDALSSTSQLNVVVIVGSGRSGTSFLAKLLDSSPRVLYRHEPDATVFSEKVPHLPIPPEEYENYFDDTRQYMQRLIRQRDPKTYRSSTGNYAFPLFLYLAKIASKIRIKINIPDLLIKGSSPIYLIKSVNSIGRAPLFLSSMPEIKYLHIVRHPCGVISSILDGIKIKQMRKPEYIDQIFKSREVEIYPYSHEKISSLSYEEKQAYCWMLYNNKIYREMMKNKNYRLVFYEELCVKLYDEILDIANHAGIEFEEQMKGHL